MIWYYRLITYLTALDLIGKSTIEGLSGRSFPWEMPGGKPVSLPKKFRSRGPPFGFLEKRREAAKYGSLLVEYLMLLRLSRLLPKRGRKTEEMALVLVLAGGGSNLFDRFFRGCVVNYFSSTPEKPCRLVFNLGDLYIAAGMVILSVTELVRGLRCIGVRGVRH